MRQCFILALDGLEYSLVTRFRLKNLMQVEYGKTDISDFKVIATPVLWASFITGLPPKTDDHGKTRQRSRDVVSLSYTRTIILGNVNKLLMPFHLERFNLLWEAIERLGIKNKLTHTKEDYARKGIKTIFEEIRPSIPLFMPTYNPMLNRRFLTLTNAIGNRSLERRLERHILEEEFQRKYITLLRVVKSFNFSQVKFLMVHFFFTDLLGHLYRGNILKMFKIYNLADKLTYRIKTMIPKDDLFLIVSDHGMKPFRKGSRYGTHSNYGYYSSNYALNLHNPKIYDFAPIVINWCKGFPHV